MNSSYAPGAPDIIALRLGMLAKGYRPVPVLRFDAKDKEAGKRPTLLSGNTGYATADEAEIRRWSEDHEQRDCRNTGPLCGQAIGLDLDIPDLPLAWRINALADAMLPATPLIRIGRAPKAYERIEAKVSIRK